LRAFFDSSALTKLYLDEEGSDLVENCCAAADDLIVSAICQPEVMSALCRAQREGRLTGGQYEAVKTEVEIDFQGLTICPLSRPVITEAVRLLETHALRGMDALHIACALVSRADVFVSFDDRQVAAARADGLSVYQPTAENGRRS